MRNQVYRGAVLAVYDAGSDTTRVYDLPRTGQAMVPVWGRRGDVVVGVYDQSAKRRSVLRLDAEGKLEPLYAGEGAYFNKKGGPTSRLKAFLRFVPCPALDAGLFG